MPQILFTLILEELYTLTKTILLTSEKLEVSCKSVSVWQQSQQHTQNLCVPFPSATSFDLITITYIVWINFNVKNLIQMPNTAVHHTTPQSIKCFPDQGCSVYQQKRASFYFSQILQYAWHAM